MSQVNANAIYDASGGSNAVLYGVAAPANSMGFRNRIINGAMVIDQRNAGASVTPTGGTYTLDRWQTALTTSSSLTLQRSSLAPAGFTNSLGTTVASAVGSLASGAQFLHRQFIEGFNFADLGWGAAGAGSVSISFLVRSSVTGTFPVAVLNGDYNRSYVSTYVVNAANTWEQKTITVPGDTTGTWPTGNTAALNLTFGLGIGSTRTTSSANAWQAGEFASVTGCTNLLATNGATFYITGVQLEAGSVASPFERRDYGRELMMCQRYYYRTADDGALTNLVAIAVEATTNGAGGFLHPVSMRVAPTITLGSGVRFYSAASGIKTTTISSNRSSTTTFSADFSFTGATAGQAGTIYRNTTNGFLEASAEL